MGFFDFLKSKQPESVPQVQEPIEEMATFDDLVFLKETFASQQNVQEFVAMRSEQKSEGQSEDIKEIMRNDLMDRAVTILTREAANYIPYKSLGYIKKQEPTQLEVCISANYYPKTRQNLDLRTYLK